MTRIRKIIFFLVSLLLFGAVLGMIPRLPQILNVFYGTVTPSSNPHPPGFFSDLYGLSTPLSPSDAAPRDEEALVCTLSVDCGQILQNLELLKPEKQELVPEDGLILPPQETKFWRETDSAFDILRTALAANAVPLDFEKPAGVSSVYIKGIGNLYEFDCGDLSGWLYTINGALPSVGCNDYFPEEGDVITFFYSCDLLADFERLSPETAAPAA